MIKFIIWLVACWLIQLGYVAFEPTVAVDVALQQMNGLHEANRAYQHIGHGRWILALILAYILTRKKKEVKKDEEV